ncbi:hypothetical protein C5167_044259 [Papaver somniferum]|uniref:Uncharacterized protein n=1 Tax=Papaver somniferum TaxID=3469 RepID=A0A4Y7L902_PAPSO|nr:hypothetical protein C5167_044259 [Papaver somniferum]
MVVKLVVLVLIFGRSSGGRSSFSFSRGSSSAAIPSSVRPPTGQFEMIISDLARGIDHAIVNNEIPDGVHELPSLLKQVCGHNKNGILLQATSMMLMASLKFEKCIHYFFVLRPVINMHLEIYRVHSDADKEVGFGGSTGSLNRRVLKYLVVIELDIATSTNRDCKEMGMDGCNNIRNGGCCHD